MKKLTALLLALLMLVLPFGSLAETVTGDYRADAIEAGRRITTTTTLSNVTNNLTGDPAVDEVIVDVLNALVITAYEQNGEFYYAISLKQDNGDIADLLSLGVALDGNDAYILSNLIGGTIVVSGDEAGSVLNRLVDMFVLIGMFTEEDAAYLKEELALMWDELVAEYASMLSMETAALDFDSYNTTALLALVETLADKVVVAEEMDVLPRNCDTPVSMVTVTITPKDVVEVANAMVQFLIDNPALADYLAYAMDYEYSIAPYISMTETEISFTEYMQMTVDELDASADETTTNMVLRMWMGEDDMPVAADLSEVDPITGDAETYLNYTRLTMNDTVTHSATYTVDSSDVTVNVVEKANGLSFNLASAQFGETNIMLNVDWTDLSDESKEAGNVVVEYVEYDDYYYESGEMSLKLDINYSVVTTGVDFTQEYAATIIVDDVEYATVNINAFTSEPGDSIKDGAVVRPAELSDADFANWFVNTYMSFSSWLQNAMLTLPTSVYTLLNTGY